MRLRQMAQIYIRGSFANITMRGLDEEQQAEVERYTAAIVNSPKMAPNRNEFATVLGHTIGGDYYEDRKAADQEFYIAVWRGVVHLLYHRSYSFVCEHCNQASYLTQRNKPALFERRYPVCPSCKHVRIVDPGGTTLARGQYLPEPEFEQLLTESIRAGLEPPVKGSPILHTPGDSKVEDPYTVLNDPEQLNKFFTGFVWNYFRQIIKENEIRHHQKGPQREIGAADRVAVLEVLSMLDQYRVKREYEERAEPHSGHYHIYCQTACTPPELTVEFAQILAKYREHDVNITYDDRCILIPSRGVAPRVEALVVRPSPVLVAAEAVSIKDTGEESYTVDRLDYRTVRGVKVSQESGMHAIESDDVIQVVRQSLPDGACQDVLDLLVGRGEHYEANIHQANHHGQITRKETIASILNIPSRQVSQHLDRIRHVLLANDVVCHSRDDEDYT